MSKLEKDKILEKIYYDVDEGFGSVRALYEKAKKDDMGISLDYVKNWMRNQPNKQRRNYKNYNSYSAPFPKYEFQIDIMDMISIMKEKTLVLTLTINRAMGWCASTFSVRKAM